jgi:hypothetical protein
MREGGHPLMPRLDELHLVTGSVEDAEHAVSAVARIARICAEIHIMGG